MADTTILIENPDVVRDIQRLAQRTGKPALDVVADAVREKLRDSPSTPAGRTPQQDAELDEILARIDALPKIGRPLTDADLYDDDGLPR